MQKNVATKLARKSFKQYGVSIISSTGKYLFVQSDNTRLSITLGNIQVLQNKKTKWRIKALMQECPHIVKYNCDLPCLSTMKTIVQCSNSFR